VDYLHVAMFCVALSLFNKYIHMRAFSLLIILAVFVGCSAVSDGDGSVSECPECESGVSILVNTPEFREPVQSPLKVAGMARGYWFFEGTLPINILDSNGDYLASSFATSSQDWMSEGLVDFEGTVEFDTDDSAGILQILNNNASGLLENQAVFSFPIRFEKGVVREYIENNIADINPVNAVVGGSWYVVEVVFGEDNTVTVTAEDGHIQSEFTAQYSFDENGRVVLDEVDIL